jgi:hypothetical protein
VTIEQLRLLVELLTWAKRWYPQPKITNELLIEVNRELRLKTLNPVTGEYSNGNTNTTS